MLALTAALVGPYFIDWSNYRADFEREAGRILGREVKVRGDATARLLPFPSVTFTDVEVAGSGPEVPAMTVETFSMDAELAPFLSGELLIFDMRIVRPRARVAIAADGSVDWAIRPSTPFDPRQVKLEKLTVTEGRLDLVHAASGREHAVTEINTDISAQTMAGPWRIAGSARLDGALTTISVVTGAAEDGRLRMRVRIDPERYGFTLETEGDAGLADSALGFKGTFKLAAKVVQRAGETAAPTPAYRVGGKFELDHLAVKVPEFRLETGPVADPYTADGHAEIALGAEPRFQIVADGAQIRFEDAAGQGGGDGQTAASLQERLNALREASLDIPRPVIPGSIELKLPAIVAGDTTVRDVRLSAEPAQDGWQINTLGATLPGRATLEASGLLRTGERDFGFRGNMLLAVAQPSGFAAWLSSNVDEAIRRLPSAGFDAEVDLSAERQVFEKLELSLGGARFDGRIENSQPAGQRGVTKVDLTGGRLDLDGVAAFAALFVGEQGTRLADHDFDLAVKAGPVVVSGITAESVDTALRLRGDTLEVDRLSVGGLEGSTLSATGRLTGIGEALAGAIDATVLSDDLGPLLARAAERFPNAPLATLLAARSGLYPGLFADANLDIKGEITGEGEARNVALKLSGEAGGTGLALTLDAEDFAGDLTAAPLSAKFNASNDEPAVLYALGGLPGLPMGFAEAATAEASIEGTLAEGAGARFAFRAQGFEASFEGSLTIANARIAAAGDAALKALDLEPWLMTAGVSVPGMGLGLPMELSGSVDLSDGLAVVSGLTGTIAGTPLSGDVNIAMRDGRPYVTGAVETQSLDVALAGEALFGEAALQQSGETWPRTPFEPAARAALFGDVEINADSVRAGALTARNARMELKLDRDGLRISDLSADLLGGKISGLIELSNNGGTGLFSGQLSLDGAALPVLLPQSGLAGSGTFTAAVTASGKSVDAMMASLAGSGTAVLKDLVIPGVRPDALTEIIAKADAIGPKIDSQQTAQFAPPLVSGGSFDAGGAELPLTVAAGVVRAPALRLSRPEATLSVTPRVDIGEWSIGATGAVEYEAGDEAVAGAGPSVRFDAEGRPGAVEVSYDTEPLAQFLTQRALEKEQARVEAMQAVLLERQRLRREARYYAALVDERARLAEEKRKAEAAAQEAAEEQAALKAAEEARRAAEAEAAAQAEAARREAETPPQQPAAPAPADDNDLPGVQTTPLPTLPDAQSGSSSSGVFQRGNMTFGGSVIRP